MVEFHEKLQELRREKGLTQEELAEDLYVSRTAISKWESGRGYPSIDSLKQISIYYGVSIDELLSGEQLLSLAERENKGNLQRICNLLSGCVDVLAFLLIVLPLYPKTVDGYVYAVNLLAYGAATARGLWPYWLLFCGLMAAGLARLVLARKDSVQYGRLIADGSILLSIIAVIFLALSREAYAATLVFLMLVIKGMLMLRCYGIIEPSKR